MFKVEVTEYAAILVLAIGLTGPLAPGLDAAFKALG